MIQSVNKAVQSYLIVKHLRACWVRLHRHRETWLLQDTLLYCRQQQSRVPLDKNTSLFKHKARPLI